MVKDKLDRCECKHIRKDHAGVDNYCYVKGCECMKFIDIEVKT